MDYLNSGDVDSALSYLQNLMKHFRMRYKKEQLRKLSDYIERIRHSIWYSEAKEKGISIGAGSSDKAGDNSHLPSDETPWYVVEQEGSRCSAQHPHIGE